MKLQDYQVLKIFQQDPYLAQQSWEDIIFNVFDLIPNSNFEDIVDMSYAYMQNRKSK